ncbi:type I restriction endonuclease subunit R [Nonlabens antarcticus]|uniref:type I restriction endonuclease subunit R n=1 Tax=Nonlabens antarcticus TaxID=392714 RepID=UPI001890DB33|nr:HsdR family type I site-specific deoxyribonuclease [Nonlabens antarcticus]
MQKFTEAQLEQAFAELIAQEGYVHVLGEQLNRTAEDVLIEEDLWSYLHKRYAHKNITKGEIETILFDLKRLPASDLYETNKIIMKRLRDGFIIKREDYTQKDFHVYLIDYAGLEEQVDSANVDMVVADPGAPYNKDANIYKFVTQMKIVENHPAGRIPDGILYINGLPLVVFEFKTAIQEDCTIHDAFKQITTRYDRDIPSLFKYNLFCVISDGVNNKAGSFFAPYEFFYAWRRIAGLAADVDGINSMFTLVQGMLHKNRLRDIARNFIFMPDSSKKDMKIVCRYPQYYAARALYDNIKLVQRPDGNGKGGTYFGATGSGKSFTMLYLARLLMKSIHFNNPTIILITDRTDLDDQLSEDFTNAKGFLGDDNIISVNSRLHLRELLQGIESGGVFLTTIHKFTEDTKILTDRNNVICISDEAHRSQTNLDQTIKVTEEGVKKTYGFAYYLHQSLPNATYVGFTGTPVDATLDVFGKVVDVYTMTESVRDEITVRLVYEGRAALVNLKNSKLLDIEQYYQEAEQAGANTYQVERSKEQSASMKAILGDPDRLKEVAKDFVNHYETRVKEGATVKGKAMFVSSSREIAYDFYKELIALRPEWAETKVAEEGAQLTEQEKKEIKPMERVKLIMTRNKDDDKKLYNMLGTKDYRKELDRQFKNEKSNFKIAIVVDMWLTGFDVPFLDTIYIDKPVQEHNLIQTISRVNRKFSGKQKGLIVDYIGIKKRMNIALKKYGEGEEDNMEEVEKSLVAMRDMLDLLSRFFHTFDSKAYFTGLPMEQLLTLNKASEFVMQEEKKEKRFMDIAKRLKAAYDICCGSEKVKQAERDYIHYYLAIRSIVFKLTKGNAPDTAQMNAKVREMIKDALESDGVHEIFKIGEGDTSEYDLFDEDYIAKINKIKLPNTKIKLLQQLLAKAIGELKKNNKVAGVDFSKKMEALVQRYNERKEDTWRSEAMDEFADEITELIWKIKEEFESGDEMGISFEEKAFYDILKSLCEKYDFNYPDDKLIELAKETKELVDSQVKYPDWSTRDDIKAALKVGLILLLDKWGYPPVERDEVYQDIFEQAENFKKNR